MDFEPAEGVEERNGQPSVTQATSWPLEEQLYTHPIPTVDQSHDVSLVVKFLNRTHGYHGVSSENILLWGLPGCGKRRIATQAALEFARKTGCKVLFIDGRTHESLLRDYRDAYTTMTGEILPQGLAVEALLLKIRITLESRRQEWLMVIFDLQVYLEEGADPQPGGPESAPTSFLPERCRIVVTSSYVLSSHFGTVDQDVNMTCGLKFAHRATCLHVVGVGEKAATQFLEDYGLDASDVASLRLQESPTLSIPPLRLVLSCASMRLSGMSLRQFRKSCELRSKLDTISAWPGSKTLFSSTMSVLWDALTDQQPLAGHILSLVSIVDRLDLPLDLLTNFPSISDMDPDDFASAVNTLRRSGLVEIVVKSGCPMLSMPLTVFRWLQLRLRAIEDPEEYSDLVETWAIVLTEYLTDPDKESGLGKCVFAPQKFWPMVRHVSALSSFKLSNLDLICSKNFLKFLHQTAMVLVEDGILHNLGLMAITHALDMCATLMGRSLPPARKLQLHREYVAMLQVRSQAFLKASKFTDAKAELQEAERYLSHHLTNDPCYRTQRRRIDDFRAHLLVIQQDFSEAVEILYPLLERPDETEDPFCVAQRHFWLTAHKTSLKADVSALKHSHVTLHYWKSLPPDEKWGHKDSRRLHWIENHMVCLMYLGKYKGALLLGRPLLKRAQELTPNFGISLTRMTYRVVLCLSALGKLDEAEEAVCHLLSQSDYKRVEDETLSHLLVVLHTLGQLLQMHGRTVEAEGVYRYILRGAQQWNVQSIAGPHKHEITGTWTRLVMCLIEQGKYTEAQEIRRKYQASEDDEKISRLIARASEAYRYMKELYARRIEAERIGTLVEWDALVDLYDMKPDLDEAISMFGDPSRRIELDQDFESDIDLYNIRRARKSKVLQLLNFPLVYQSFVQLNPRRTAFDLEGPLEDLWCDRSQTILGQYWKFCECTRKRRRSASVNLNVLIKDATLWEQEPEPVDRGARFTQRSISEWVRRTPKIKAVPPGCSDSCPCIIANAAGPAASLKYESELFIWKESEEKPLPESKRQHLYRGYKPKRQPIPDHSVFTYDEFNNQWLWMQTEFWDGEEEGENYIIPRALEIPRISITTAEGEKDLLPEAQEKQKKLTEFYERDYASDFAMELERSTQRNFEVHRLDNILEDDEDEVER